MQTYFSLHGRIAAAQLRRIPRVLWQSAAVFAGVALIYLPHPANAEELSRPLVVQHGRSIDDDSRSLMRAKARDQGAIRVRVGVRVQDKRERGSNIDDASDLEITKDLIAARVLGFARKNQAKKFKTVPAMSVTVTADELDRLQDDPGVEWVREVVKFKPSLEFTRHLVGADSFSSIATGQPVEGNGFAIAIIDTGVDDSHPMLNGKVITEAGACFSGNFAGGQSKSLCDGGLTREIGPTAGLPCDLEVCWHGTHVASTAAGAGVVNGIARGAEIIPIKAVYNDRGMVSFDDDDLYEALVYVYSLRNTYNIAAVNMSLQGPMFSSACDTDFPDYAAIFDLLIKAGIAPVAASGNMSSDMRVAAPGCVSNSISVAASTKSDRVATFSNFTENVKLLAPGQEIHAAIPGGAYKYASGTSMAAPHVAGAIALLREAKPRASIDELTSALVCSGKPIVRSGSKVAKPRIDLIAAKGALSGKPARRWTFDAQEESADWSALRGDWETVNGAYIGRADRSSFVGSMFSLCGKTAYVRAKIKARDAANADTPTRAGLLLNASVDYVQNTISGYWLTYSNQAGGGASILQLNSIRLDGRPGGSVTEVCFRKRAPVHSNRTNEVEAEISASKVRFDLNGVRVCTLNAELASPRALVAADLGVVSPEKALSVQMVRILPRKPSSNEAAVAAAEEEGDISRIAATKRTIMSVVRRPLEPAKAHTTGADSDNYYF